MALIYPDSTTEQVVFASSAEQKVYKLCKQKLDDSFSVFYSVMLTEISEDKGLQSNEMDFVIYHPELGLFVIEVKGGKIAFDNTSRQFLSKNRFGQSFKIKDPFQQALIWKSKLVRKLKKASIKVPVTHLACFPHIEKQDLPKGETFEFAICKDELNHLSTFLKNAAGKAHPEKFLKFEDCFAKVKNVISGKSFHSVLHLKDYLERHEKRVLDIENIQANIIQPIAKAKSLGIEGEAGTGKTALARLLSEHFFHQGKKVLFLTSNRFLQQSNKELLPEEIEFATYIGVANWYGINLLTPPAKYKDNREHWLQKVAPELLFEKIKESKKKFDILICDEAQDVQPIWWKGFLELMRDDSSRIFTFFDRSQGVFSGSGQGHKYSPEVVLPVPSNYFPLVHNYRMTQQISDFAKAFRAGTLQIPSHSGRMGYQSQLISYEKKEEGLEKLEDLITQLVEVEKVDPSDIAILSARHPEHKVSILHGQKYIAGNKLTPLDKKRADAHDGIKLATIQSFKGLEAPIVILCNLSEYNLPLDHPLMKSLVYVGITRAKHMAYVIADVNETKHEHFKRVLEGLQKGTELIINPSDLGSEVSGKVTYFNSLRFGEIEIDSEKRIGNSDSILFFPHDVASFSTKKISTGDRVAFEVRKEAGQLIAMNLRLL